jgi:hypothetical protein
VCFFVNSAAKGRFYQSFNTKWPSWGRIFQNKTPGCVYIALHRQILENARQRVRPFKNRTFKIFALKSIRFFTALCKAIPSVFRCAYIASSPPHKYIRPAFCKPDISITFSFSAAHCTVFRRVPGGAYPLERDS